VKVLILNSGLGKRMGTLTADRPKCMVEITNGFSTIDFQMKTILKAGINDIVITTGPFAAVLQNHIGRKFPQAEVTYINNPIYEKTNYIYSIALAEEFLHHDDIIMMHGDLIFEESVFADILQSAVSAMVVDKTLPLPEKDFKAVIDADRITKVGIEFFDNALAAQPLYKLLKKDWIIWLDRILKFCDEGSRGVYAENAFNEVSAKMDLRWFDVNGRVCGEIDTEDDLNRMRPIAEKVILK